MPRARDVRRSRPLAEPRFRLLWSARAISFVGDGMATIALLLYVRSLGRGGLWAAALLLAFGIPRLLGPLAGTLVDRLSATRVMVACDLGQALLFAAIAAWLPPLPVVLALVAAASTLATLFRPAGASLVPALVPARELLAANAWIGMAVNLQIVAGPPLGGIAFQALSIRGALALDAVTFVVSAALIARLEVPSVEEPSRERVGFLTDLRDGLAFVLRDPLLRMVVVTLFLAVLFAAVDNVALVFLTRDELHASAAGYGAVAASFGVGMTIAAVVLARLRRDVSPLGVYLGGLLLGGVGTLVTGLATGLEFAAVAQVVAGAGNSADNVGGSTLIQRHVPPRMLGRTFGLVGTSAMLGSSLSSLLAGALVDLASARVAFVVGGAGVLATVVPAAFLGARRRRR